MAVAVWLFGVASCGLASELGYGGLQWAAGREVGDALPTLPWAAQYNTSGRREQELTSRWERDIHSCKNYTIQHLTCGIIVECP